MPKERKIIPFPKKPDQDLNIPEHIQPRKPEYASPLTITFQDFDSLWEVYDNELSAWSHDQIIIGQGPEDVISEPSIYVDQDGHTSLGLRIHLNKQLAESFFRNMKNVKKLEKLLRIHVDDEFKIEEPLDARNPAIARVKRWVIRPNNFFDRLTNYSGTIVKDEEVGILPINYPHFSYEFPNADNKLVLQSEIKNGLQIAVIYFSQVCKANGIAIPHGNILIGDPDDFPPKSKPAKKIHKHNPEAIARAVLDPDIPG